MTTLQSNYRRMEYLRPLVVIAGHLGAGLPTDDARLYALYCGAVVSTTWNDNLVVNGVEVAPVFKNGMAQRSRPRWLYLVDDLNAALDGAR